MPTSNLEAQKELERMLEERDLTAAWLSRRIGRNEMWVSRKLNGQSKLTIDDYNLMKSAIVLVPILERQKPA